jgi:2-desacetyl-2-hydroxyethyl bacteriochlorophyllide A dehydrogenase
MRVKRVLVPGRDQVLLEEIEIADRPGPGQITVESEFTFVSAGTELANFTGLDRSVYVPGSWCAYPWASGYANVGRITALGEGVLGFELGERVFSSSRHQQVQHIRVPQPGGSGNLLLERVPEGLDGAVAAACIMPEIALSALSNSRWRLNDLVGVWGLGMVGNMAAQLYRLAGCRVIGIDPARSRRDLASSIGIEAVCPPQPQNVRSEICALGAAEGLDIGVDAVGDAAVVDSIHEHVRKFGQLVLLGSPRREHQADLTPLMRSVKTRGLKLRGSLQWLIPFWPQPGFEQSTAGNLATVLDLAARGRLQIEPLISHRMPPREIERAYRGLLEDKETYIGVALAWQG